MSFRTRIGQGGRVVLPARLRAAAGLAVGDAVVVKLEDGTVRLVKLDEAIRRAQALVRRHVSPGRSLSDELIAERKAEAVRE
ncbi:MAG: AbrB/MazE/SpoVT family DNA-binding domain-containing protein [Actinomycetota bacterium]